MNNSSNNSNNKSLQREEGLHAKCSPNRAQWKTWMDRPSVCPNLPLTRQGSLLFCKKLVLYPHHDNDIKWCWIAQYLGHNLPFKYGQNQDINATLIYYLITLLHRDVFIYSTIDSYIIIICMSFVQLCDRSGGKGI